MWVTDPQKYADARLHDDYVSALAEHEAVTMVVLNQVDRLTAPEAAQCVGDLRRLLARDGLPQASILATSARTGHGIDELRQRLANTVVGQTAARTRLAGDLRMTAAALGRHVAASEPSVRAADERELMDALARTAGVPTVVEAVQRDYRMESAAGTASTAATAASGHRRGVVLGEGDPRRYRALLHSTADSGGAGRRRVGDPRARHARWGGVAAAMG